MALNPDIRDQAYQFFMEEAPELLQIIETGLLSLHHERSTAQIHTLMRSAHSLKGGAASVGLDAVAALAHRLENIFKALYNDALNIDTELENQLFQAYDCLRLPLMEQIRTGTCNWEMALAVAEPVFSQIERRCGDALTQAATYIPSSVDMGIDMVVSIFEVDVAQGLERMAAALTQPEGYPVAGEVRAQVEVFSGFAELLNLPGFGAIASTVQQALDAVPERSMEIAELALMDFERSRQAVLAGDRTGGSGPSPALVALAHGMDTPAAGRATDPENPNWNRQETDCEDAQDHALHEWIEYQHHELENLFPDSLTSPFSIQNKESFNDSITFFENADDNNVSANTEAEIIEAEIDSQNESNLAALTSGDDRSWSDQLPQDITAADSVADSADESSDHSVKPPLADPTSTDANADLLAALPSDPLADALPLLHEMFGNLALPQEQRENESLLAARNDETLTEPLDSPTDLAAFASLDAESNTDVTASPSFSLEAADTESVINPEAELTATFEDNTVVNDQGNAQLASAKNAIERIAEPAATASTNLPSDVNQSVNWKSPPLQTANPTPSLTVRVDAERLERMNNLVGELAINRSSLALQNEQTQQVVRELHNRFARFQTVVNRLQGLSDQLLVTSERLPTLPANALPVTALPQSGVEQPYASTRTDYASISTAVGVEFDPLEMDRYSPLYLQVQEILEELHQLEESVEDITLFARQSHQIMDQQQHMMMQLRDELVWARMLPIGEIINRFPRVLRDLSVTYHKPVALKLTGTEVLIDRAILEKLYDPLLHLLRNAFDHGIEPPDLRQQRGKSETGQIELRAFHKGNQTVIEVRDDGQGLNLERIRERSVELGWLSAEQAMLTPPTQLFELIFEPGFSTSKQINELSGRGFGLDVVRSQLQAIKGTVSVTSAPGKGTTFTLYLPLTLTITQLIICSVGNLPFALPTEGIADLLSPQPSQIQPMGSQQMLHWREQMIPIYSLASLLDYACPITNASSSRIWSAFPSPKEWASPLLVLRQEHQFFALQVDRILMEQEMVIKPFGAALTPPSYMFGCSILGDGSPVPVIDAASLLKAWLNQVPDAITVISPTESQFADRAIHGSPLTPTAVQPAPAPTIMVVDDAMTLRRTMALFLEREGFRVLQAQDGQEAVDQLQQTTSVQLIICDIEMPNMNGFEFLSYRRQDPKLAAIPVVILTSRSNEKHRWLAMQLGATAYFTKPYLEHEFLSTIKTLI